MEDSIATIKANKSKKTVIVEVSDIIMEMSPDQAQIVINGLAKAIKFLKK